MALHCLFKSGTSILKIDYYHIWGHLFQQNAYIPIFNIDKEKPPKRVPWSPTVLLTLLVLPHKLGGPPGPPTAQ